MLLFDSVIVSVCVCVHHLCLLTHLACNVRVFLALPIRSSRFSSQCLAQKELYTDYASYVNVLMLAMLFLCRYSIWDKMLATANCIVSFQGNEVVDLETYEYFE